MFFLDVNVWNGAGALSPSGAPAGEAQPDFLANHVPNPDPSIQDWVEAYTPVSKALDNAFEHRITKDNAQQVQFQLAVVRPCSSIPFCPCQTQIFAHVGNSLPGAIYRRAAKGSLTASRYSADPCSLECYEQLQSASPSFLTQAHLCWSLGVSNMSHSMSMGMHA